LYSNLCQEKYTSKHSQSGLLSEYATSKANYIKSQQI
jgi:hypothetical protein